MRVSLVNVRRSEKPVLPMGILYIAGVLEKNGYEVRVDDLVFKEDEDKYLKEIAAYRPDIVGISFLTTALLKTKGLIESLRRLPVKTVITAGGPHISGLPKESMSFLGLDYAIMGEGEMSFLRFCGALKDKTGVRGIGGLVYPDNGGIGVNPVSGFIEDLDALPFPAWHLVDMKNYLFPPGYIKGLFYKRTMPVMTGRGCPSKCIFCSSPNIFGRKIRRRSVGNVILEIKTLKERFDIDGLFFLDDTFTLNPAWVMEFCDVLMREKLGLDWSCQTRVNVVTPELLKKMKQAGCVQVDYGIESGSDRILKIIEKGTNTEQVRNAFRLAKEAGLRTYGSVLIGNPGETPADIEETKSLIRELKPSLTLFNFLTPFPGSELYHNARKYKVNVKDGEKLFSYDTRTADQPIMSSELTSAEMRRARSELQNEVFFRNYLSYLNFKNLSFVLEVAFYAFRSPLKIAAGIVKAIRNRALDDLMDTVYYEYCKGKRSGR